MCNLIVEVKIEQFHEVSIRKTLHIESVPPHELQSNITTSLP
jgi:hypothetical protein